MEASAKCEGCGHPLTSGVPGALCAACLMRVAMQAENSSGAFEWVPPDPHLLGSLFPELEIIELTGRGGMGAVYKARQRSLSRLVAIKILPIEMAAEEGFADRFAREARLMARLSHPHIVAIYDFGRRGETYFLLMEFIEGLNLRRLMQAGTLKPAECLKIVPQICDALQYAHDNGVVHRDIKPENILLDRAGSIKITDFGLARLIGSKPGAGRTAPSSAWGTVHYIAPEQIENPQSADHRVDIYALGVVFYQMLTGELPIGRFSVPSRKVKIDVRLDEVVLHALEKDPQIRYQKAQDVKTDVQAITTTPPPLTTRGVVAKAPAPNTWRPPAMVAAALIFALVALAGWLLVYALHHYSGDVASDAPGRHIDYGGSSQPAGRIPETRQGGQTLNGGLTNERLSAGTLCWLPRTWRSPSAVIVADNSVVLSGTTARGPALRTFSSDLVRSKSLTALLPTYYQSIRRLAVGGGVLMLGGGSSPEPGGFGVKSRGVIGLLDTQTNKFKDLSSALRRVDPDPYVLGIGGVAYADGRFLAGGAGGTTALVSYNPATDTMRSLAPAVPGYFAVNDVLFLGGRFLIDGAGPGPGGEPGTPPALGFITPGGRYTDLANVIPAGLGVMGESAFDGRECMIQGYNTADAHPMLVLFNPATLTFRDVTAVFPKYLSVQCIVGRAGRFWIGGFIQAQAYFAEFDPDADTVHELASVLPPARTASALAFGPDGFYIAGISAQDRVFIESAKPGMVGSGP